MKFKERVLVALLTETIQPLTQRINDMSAIVDALVARVTEQTTQSAGLRVIIDTAIAELAALKAALTAALGQVGISAEDAAKLQNIIDSAGADSALDASKAQELADAVAVNAPTN